MQNIKNNSGILFVALIGLALGMLSAYGHTYLPQDYEGLAFSYSIWLVCAFAAGLFATTKKQALIYGAATPIIASAAAYLLLKLFLEGGTVALSMVGIFLIGALLFGPALSYLALLWKKDSEKALLIAPVLVSSLLISEGVAHLIRVTPDIPGYFYIALGIAAFALLYRQPKERLLIIPMIGAIIPVSILIYFIFMALFTIVLVIEYWGSGFSDF